MEGLFTPHTDRRRDEEIYPNRVNENVIRRMFFSSNICLRLLFRK